MAVVIDYQNVHVTAAGLFLPARPPEEALIDPHRFSCQLARARNTATIEVLLGVHQWREKPVRLSRREKRVNVMCSPTLVDLARCGLHDIIVPASRDTDPAPAFDHAARTGHAKIEAAKWYHPNKPSTRGRIKTERRLWTTSMTQEHFSASPDLRDDT
ncbi:hypothetical protein [Actinomyces gerencseriae]|uniref:hypothetical protein n=1 Tax=Actinomyces gerencseriae TaxID=52769 RepID=UPI000A02C7F3|nr:hypothetical protein [Actinomyces gerencseriae]